MLSLVTSCASGGLRGQIYRDPEVAFRVGPIAKSWRAIEVSEARLAFRDDASRSTVAVNARCGNDGDDVPLTALTQHLFLYFTNRELLRQEATELNGREALRTELLAELDGVPKHFVIVVLKKDGCVYDFMQVADPASGPRATADFDRFVAGFATVDLR